MLRLLLDFIDFTTAMGLSDIFTVFFVRSFERKQTFSEKNTIYVIYAND